MCIMFEPLPFAYCQDSQFGRIDFGDGDSAAPTPSLHEYNYQVVTSDGTLVKCLSQAEKMNNSTLKFSEVQRKRAESAPTDTLVSDTPVGVTCQSQDRLEAEVMQSWNRVSTPLVCKPASGFRGNKSQYISVEIIQFGQADGHFAFQDASYPHSHFHTTTFPCAYSIFKAIRADGEIKK